MPSHLSQSSVSIEELAVKINELHREALKHGLRSATNQFFCGHGLCIVKKRLPHGEFQDWLKSTFEDSPRTANRYMRFYRVLRKRGIKPDTDAFAEILNEHGAVAEVIRVLDAEKASAHGSDDASCPGSNSALDEDSLPQNSESTANSIKASAEVVPATPKVYVDAVATATAFGAQAVLSAFDDLLTGPEIRDRVYRMDRVAIDPCSNSTTNPNIDAAVCLTEQSDGLMEDWVGGLAYVHPPYDGIERWVAKTLQEFQRNNIESAILLLPNQMETEWMADLDPFVRVVIREPITIVNERTGMQVASAQIPMVVVYIGKETEEFVALFSDLGTAFQRILP